MTGVRVAAMLTEHLRRSAGLYALFIALIAIAGGGYALIERGQRELQTELKELRTLVEQAYRQQPRAASTEPPLANVKIKLEQRPSLGKEDAPLVLVEFTDYECPFCNRFYNTAFPEIKKHYIDTGKVRYLVYDLPMKYHPHAVKAAQASLCADEQGKYWEMRRTLFDNAKALQADKIVGYAKQAALDLTKFRTCFGSDKHLARIQQTTALAHAAGVTGTPTFILGKASGRELEGRKLIGVLPYAMFDRQIRDLLNAK